MEIYINEKRLQEDLYSDKLSFKELLEKIEDDMENEVIEQIFLNGVEVNQDFLLNSDYTSADISTLKFVTKRTGFLIRETLNQAQDYLPKLKTGVGETAELFRQGDKSEGNNKYQLCIEGMQWYIGVLDNILSLIDDQKKTKIGTEMLDKFNQILKELMLAFEKEDMVFVADLLEYEIPDHIDKFIEFNEELNKILD